MSQEHTGHDFGEVPLTVAQRTPLNTGNVPPFINNTEYIGAKKVMNDLMVRAHVQTLSDTDMELLAYLEKRVFNHETSDTIVVFKLFEFRGGVHPKMVVQSSNENYVNDVMAGRKKKFKYRTYGIFTEQVKTANR